MTLGRGKLLVDFLCCFVILALRVVHVLFVAAGRAQVIPRLPVQRVGKEAVVTVTPRPFVQRVSREAVVSYSTSTCTACRDGGCGGCAHRHTSRQMDSTCLS